MKELSASAAERILRMERLFDDVCSALLARADVRTDAGLAAKIHTLEEYLAGEWLSDYERDERGELPPGLKRGVLAQGNQRKKENAYEKKLWR